MEAGVWQLAAGSWQLVSAHSVRSSSTPQTSHSASESRRQSQPPPLRYHHYHPLRSTPHITPHLRPRHPPCCHRLPQHAAPSLQHLISHSFPPFATPNRRTLSPQRRDTKLACSTLLTQELGDLCPYFHRTPSSTVAALAHRVRITWTSSSRDLRGVSTCSPSLLEMHMVPQPSKAC